MILDPARSRCLILELKHVKDAGKMAAALEEAGSQIVQKKYESELIYQGYTVRLQYALAFCDKQCRITGV